MSVAENRNKRLVLEYIELKTNYRIVADGMLTATSLPNTTTSPYWW